MIKTSIYKCPCCGSIMIVPVNEWNHRCAVCNVLMLRLDDEFDLSEIVTCENENGSVEQA